MYASTGTMFDWLRRYGVRGVEKNCARLGVEPTSVAHRIEAVEAVFLIDHMRERFTGSLVGARMPYRSTWWEIPCVHALPPGFDQLPEGIDHGDGRVLDLKRRIAATKRNTDELRRNTFGVIATEGEEIDGLREIHLTVFGDLHKGAKRAIDGPVFQSSVVVDETGTLVCDIQHQIFDFTSPEALKMWTVAEMKDIAKQMYESAEDVACSVLVAASLLNCSNVEKVLHKGRPRPVRTRAERKRVKLLPPRVDYHTLRIFAGADRKRIIYDGPGSSDPSMLKAHHLCRGHYRTYVPERPLFGKYTGTFWVPAHTKGSTAQGIVEKDYRLVQQP